MTKFQELVKKSQAGHIEGLSVKDLLSSYDAEVLEGEKSVRRETKSSRRALWSQELDSIPMDQVVKLDETMSSFVDKHVTTRVEMTEPRELTASEKEQLAELFVDYQRINDLLQVKYAEIKSLIFGHLDHVAEDSDVPPSQQPGEVLVESHGIRFKREGGRRKAPTVDWSKLKEALGERYEELVCTREEIPAHVEVTASEEKLMESIQSGDVPLEMVRESLIPGSWMSPKFVVRKVR